MNLRLFFGTASAVFLIAPAGALAKPRLTLAFAPQGADAGAPVAYAFSASKVPKRARLSVQRRQGTARHYKTVATVSAGSGTGTLPPLAIGAYKLRLVAEQTRRVGKHKTRVTLAQTTANLYVYGTTKFADLFGDDEQVLSLPTATFPYTRKNTAGEDFSRSFYTIKAEDNTCRQVTVDWAAPYNTFGPSKGAAPSTLSIVQESSDPATGTTPQGQISQVSSSLIPGQSWGVVAPPQSREEPNIHVNGTASCYTTTLRDSYVP